MASWETQATASGFDANAARNSIMEGRQRGNESQNFGLGLNTGGFEQSSHTTVSEGTGDYLLRGFTFGLYDGREYNTTTSGYDIVGINGNQVEPMRQSIRDYVSEVQGLIDTTLSTSADQARNAFRGEEAIAAVNAYIDKIKDYCKNITSTLLAFSDKLADVGNAWKAAQENIAGNVNSSTGTFSEGTAYTESVQYNR